MIKPLLFLLEDPHGNTGLVFIDQSAHRRGKIREQAIAEERASRRVAHREDVAATLGGEDATTRPRRCSEEAQFNS